MHTTEMHVPKAAGLAALGPGHPVLVTTSARDGHSALSAAQVIASHTKAPVVALSVVEESITAFNEPGYGFVSEAYDDVRANARLTALKNRVASVAGPDASWETPVRVGATERVIADEARDRQAGLIVMDSGRHNWIARLLVGETTLRTIRWAECPVLAVGSTFDHLPHVAVAAIDFSPSSIAAARESLALLSDHATLYLVHVWRRSLSDHPSERARDDEYERSLVPLFERAVRTLAAPAGVTVVTMTMLGEPAGELLAFAAAQGADLIVAGRRGRKFFERLFVGSVTTALVRGAECSVLVTPDPPLAEADELARLVSGMFESEKPEDWPAELDDFSRRNHGRRVLLEADDPSVGRRIHVRGYTLAGAAYDPNDGRAELMLGDPASPMVHLTHSMPGVKLVAVRSGPEGRDEALLIAHGGGWAMLTLTPAELPSITGRSRSAPDR